MISRLLRFLLIITFLASNLLSLNVRPVQAAGTCNFLASPPIFSWTPATDPASISLSYPGPGLVPTQEYHLILDQTGPDGAARNEDIGFGTADTGGGIPSFIFRTPASTTDSRWQLLSKPLDPKILFLIKKGDPVNISSAICTFFYAFTLACTVRPLPPKTTSYGPGQQIIVGASFIVKSQDGSNTAPFANRDIDLRLFNNLGAQIGAQIDGTTNSGGGYPATTPFSIPAVSPGTTEGWWEIAGARDVTSAGVDPKLCTNAVCVTATPDQPLSACPGPPPVSGGGGGGAVGKNPCASGTCLTALGSIPTNATDFAGKILTIAISLAGGIALIIMVRGAIKILMAAGDPQKINDGRDMIVGAIAGLMFLIFSVLILKFLGKDFLGLFRA